MRSISFSAVVELTDMPGGRIEVALHGTSSDRFGKRVIETFILDGAAASEFKTRAELFRFCKDIR